MREITKWAKEIEGPSSNKAQLLRGAGNQKAAHIKGQRKQMASYTEKPLDHGRQMGSKQILDTYGRKARARPRHHQPVPSQYRAW